MAVDGAVSFEIDILARLLSRPILSFTSFGKRSNSFMILFYVFGRLRIKASLKNSHEESFFIHVDIRIFRAHHNSDFVLTSA